MARLARRARRPALWSPAPLVAADGGAPAPCANYAGRSPNGNPGTRTRHPAPGWHVIYPDGWSVCFIETPGAGAGGARRALAEGGEVQLIMPTSASVVRVFALTGTDGVLPNFADLDEALQPAPAAPGPGTRPSPA